MQSKLSVVISFLIHGGYEGIAGWGSKRISLQFILIDYVIVLKIDPCFSKETCPKLVILVVFSLVSNYWLEMIIEKLVFWFLEETPIMCWKFKTYN
jgi:hypothetical protein